MHKQVKAHFASLSDAPIGTIALEIDRTWRHYTSKEKITAKHAGALIWKTASEVFIDRSDYQLWRLVTVAPSTGERIDEILKHFMAGLTCPHHYCFWSTLAICGEHNHYRQLKAYQSHHPDFAKALLHTLDESLTTRVAGNTFPNAPVESSLIIFLAEATRIRLQWIVEPTAITFSDIISRYRSFSDIITKIDPDWWPGRTIDIHCLVAEWGKTHSAIGPWDYTKYQVAMVRALLDTKWGLYEAFDPYDPTADGLLQTARFFARSAWLMTRAMRIAEEQRLHDGKEERIDHHLLRYLEYNSLADLCYKERDHGDYFEAGWKAQMLLNLTNDNNDHLNSVDYSRLADIAATVGLEIPAKVRKERKRHSVANPKSQFGTDSEARTDIYIPVLTPYLRKMAADQERSSEWIMVKALRPRCTVNPLSLLVAVVQEQRAFPRTSRLAALRLAIKYGLIDLAATLLATNNSVEQEQDRVRIPKADILAFAWLIAQGYRSALFGVDKNAYFEWRKTLRRTLKLHTDWFSVDEALFLHETRLAPFHSSVLGHKYTDSIVRKYLGLMSKYELEATYDTSFIKAYKIQSHDGLNVTDHLRYSREHFRETVPVFVSIANITGDILEVVVTTGMLSRPVSRFQAKDGDWHIQIPKFLSGNKVWDINTKPPDRRRIEDVPWEEDFLLLSSLIVSEARALDHNANHLVIALEPQFMQVPWQNLILRHTHRVPWVVSIVPALGWVPKLLKHSSSSPQKMKLTIDLDSGRDLTHLKRSIESNLAEIKGSIRESVAIVLGHGVEDWDIPAISVDGRILQNKDWYELASHHRITIVHSCFCGSARGNIIGSIGGVPGIMLSLKTEVLCAPTIEVSIEAAKTLDAHLSQWLRGNMTFMKAYMNAISEDPAVSLYTIYGTPSDTTMPRRKGTNGGQHRVVTKRSFVSVR